MAVLIGSARSSYGNTTIGDQNNGKEVSTGNWYPHSKGWYVLRANDKTALSVPTIYPEWREGVTYTTGQRVRHDGTLYKVLQDHTS